jgi:hypothetical protein
VDPMAGMDGCDASARSKNWIHDPNLVLHCRGRPPGPSICLGSVRHAHAHAHAHAHIHTSYRPVCEFNIVIMIKKPWIRIKRW